MNRTVVLVVMVMVMMMTVVGESESSPARQSFNQLLQEEAIQKQLKLIQKLIDVVLNISKCPANITVVKLDTKDEDTAARAATETSTEMLGGVESTTQSPEASDGGGEAPSSPPPPDSATSQPDAPTTPPSDCNYAGLSKTHTMLLEKNTACKSYAYGLKSDDEKQLILDLHNRLRAKVARGDEKRGSPGPQPPAANMRELVWNDQLAEVAQAWANQCPTGHDGIRDRAICSKDYFVGQNIHYYWGSDPNPDWERGVDEWYDEVEDLPGGFVEAFKDLGSEIKIGHYTQVVWAETKEVGCGVVYYEDEIGGKLYPESKTYVCNYGPAGNVINFPLYNEGPAASQCPEGVSQTYEDLCAWCEGPRRDISRPWYCERFWA